MKKYEIITTEYGVEITTKIILSAIDEEDAKDILDEGEGFEYYEEISRDCHSDRDVDIKEIKEETPCPDCGATGLHGCTGKKYPGSDDVISINQL